VEDGRRDEEDPRSQDQADSDLRARAGVHQPFGSGNIEFKKPISADEAREILRKAPGCLVIDKHEPGGYVTPHEAAGEDATYISRIREDNTVAHGLSMWVVADNLRKGAALNAVQIAEVLVNRKLIQAKKKAA
jgi:aspartate-semialdehyde dehydrogenase